MDKSTRAGLGAVSVVVAVIAGVNFMANNERNTNWLLIAIIFALLAIFLFWWMGAEERRAQRDAEQEAREKIRLAEEEVRRSRTRVEPKLADQSVKVAPPPMIAEAAFPPVNKQEAPPPAPVIEAAPVIEVPPVSQQPVAVIAEVPAAEESVVIPAPHEVEVASAPTETKPIAEPAVGEVAATLFAPVEETILTAPVALEQPFASDSAAVEENPAARITTKPTGDDDLTLIEGIGPVYRDALHKGGVTTFAGLSALDRDAIDALLKTVGARRSMTTATWQQQAQLAAKGDWEALKALQASLTGGRK